MTTSLSGEPHPGTARPAAPTWSGGQKGSPALRSGFRLRDLQGELSRLGALVVLVLVATWLSPSFLQAENIRVVLLAVSTVGVMAIGMTFVLLAGEIDLSIGGIAVLSAVIGALLLPTGSALLVIGATLLTGVAAGIVNGICVTAFRVPSLIVTLATLGIARAAGNMLVGGQASYPNELEAYLWFGRGTIAGVPVPIVLFALAGIVAIAVVRFSIFGRMLYATGGNAAAAALSGIDVRMVRIVVFAVSGACAALAGIMEGARLSYINPAGFMGVELAVIAVTILGGTALTGGRGTIEGTLIAALIIGIINNALNLLGVSVYIQQIVIAGVILAVVLPDSFRRGSRE